MEPYQQAPSQILRAIRACVTQDGEWTRDLPWMSQPALTASDRGIGNRLTGRKVAKTYKHWTPNQKKGCPQPIFCVRCDKDVSRTRPIPGGGRGLRAVGMVAWLPDSENARDLVKCGCIMPNQSTCVVERTRGKTRVTRYRLD